MATILLQAAGAFLGSVLGPVGSAIGSAAGAMAGYAIDNALIQSTRRIEGPRLNGMRPFQAEEGAVLPRIFGTARVSGTMIWATRFEEKRTTRRQGMKGGPKVTEYSYYGNVAFGLCEGPAACIRRIWADGRELDLDQVDYRFYPGDQAQLPDPLIEAKQGTDNTPAYRGICYIVFERLPLDAFGNRIPQFQFEVLAPVGDFHKQIRAVTLIPGSTEFGLSPQIIKQRIAPGKHEVLNRHIRFGASDFAASIDELQALCPNLRHVALVVTWFGTDLRAGSCRIVPGVTSSSDGTESSSDSWVNNTFDGNVQWSVAGLDRQEGHVVSRKDDRAAYGGTPSDNTVIAAIQELKERGLEVAFYPFVMMDIPDDNILPDPWGAATQPAYPWRGRLTASVAPGLSGSPDQSAAIYDEIGEFLGSTAGPADIHLSGSANWALASNQEGYRRMILHYASLCAEAGGVDAFLIGSELRGLTQLRDDSDNFPFVHGLRELAREVRHVLGPSVKITYGADWSEYFGYQPADGFGDVYWNLDDLWMDEAINAIGIDNYMPLSDWRDVDCKGNNPDGATSVYDLEALRQAINSGEGFDWFYASPTDRNDRNRTPITDGAHGKPWVYRFKDIASWWLNNHFERRGGVEIQVQSPWIPGAKPVWFTELGCPAIDKGANQPNVFYDPKSDESTYPYFSNGGRDTLIQRRFLRAHFDHWTSGAIANPVSPLTGMNMVDTDRLYCWSWDTRPYPAFPLDTEAWSDGSNWLKGHWLNGRVEAVEIGDVINAVLERHDFAEAMVASVDAMAEGIVDESAAGVREILEPLINLHGIIVREEAEGLVFSSASRTFPERPFLELVENHDEPIREEERQSSQDIADELVLFYRDPFQGYESRTTRVASGLKGIMQSRIGYPGILHEATARALASRWLSIHRKSRRQVKISLPPASGLEIGDRINLPDDPDTVWVVNEIEEGLVDRIRAVRHVPLPPEPDLPILIPSPTTAPKDTGAPLVFFLDLPMSDRFERELDAFRVAAWSRPWSRMLLESSPEETGFTQRSMIPHAAQIGRLLSDMGGGHGPYRNRNAYIDVDFEDAELNSVSVLQLLSGANAAAVLANGGTWEIFQFQTAEELSAGRWRLSCLLRGQLGTEDAMASGPAIGSPVILLDDAVTPAGINSGEVGLAMNWRIRPDTWTGELADASVLVATGGIRAITPLSPVHLRMKQQADGSILFNWIGRYRKGGDNWDIISDELGDFHLSIEADGIGLIHEVTASGFNYIWPVEAIASAGPLTEITVDVREVGGPSGLGLPARKTFLINPN